MCDEFKVEEDMPMLYTGSCKHRASCTPYFSQLEMKVCVNVVSEHILFSAFVVLCFQV